MMTTNIFSKLFRTSLLILGLIAFSGLETNSVNAQGFDGYGSSAGFGYAGYGMGNYGYGYRNRLPTPPYFSIFSPVYYGRRYERPYGMSPFAATGQPTSHPSYYSRPKQVPVVGGYATPYTSMHLPSNRSTFQQQLKDTYLGENVGSVTVSDASSTVTGSAVVGKALTVVNPFVRESKTLVAK